MACLILSIAANSGGADSGMFDPFHCSKFRLQIKDSQVVPVTVKYGLFSYHDPNEDECKSIYDNDGDKLMLTSQYKVAQAIAIITILMLTSSIICVSILLCRPFSPCIMKLNQFLLVIVLAANITVAVLMIQKSTVKMFDDYCDLDYNLFNGMGGRQPAGSPSSYTPNTPSGGNGGYTFPPQQSYPIWPSSYTPNIPSGGSGEWALQEICDIYPAICNFGGRKLASSSSCKFTLLVGGGLNWCTSVLLITTFIISLIFGCNEVSESDNIEASEKVDDKIYQEEKPEIHVAKEEEPDIFVAEATYLVIVHRSK